MFAQSSDFPMGRDDVDGADGQQQHRHHLLPQRQQGLHLQAHTFLEK